MKIIKNEIHIGIQKPFTILHMTDTHLTRTDEADSGERVAFAKERGGRYFFDADKNLQFAIDHVKKTGFQLVHTGDLMDFITPENLKTVKRFADETNLLMIAGNHEQAHCVNNVFCEKDYAADLEIREQTFDRVQLFFNNDIRFFAKEINGVMLVGIDDSNYQIRPEALKALQEVVALGKPIILFVHIPLSTLHFDEKFGCDLIAMPNRITDEFTPWQTREQKANADTVKAHEYIVNQPLIKAVVAGHNHRDYETPTNDELKQILTDISTLREIIIT